VTETVEHTADPLVRVVGLRKSFFLRDGLRSREFVAVDDVSFSIAAGGSLAIVGESGSGKTTVARMLVGLERPTSGSIVIAGTDRTRPSTKPSVRRARGREAQIVFQDPYSSLDRRQSVHDCIAEIVKLHFKVSGEDVAGRVRELASLVGLDARQVRSRPRDLSGGQRQRVAIARALAARPKLLILDESVAALDVSIQAQVLNLLTDIRAQTGISYLLISHDLAVVRQITEHTIVMRAGAVVERGTTGDVLDNPATEYARLLRDSVPHPGWVPRARPSISEGSRQAD
jgi:ABC-type glutathione transport system ATPase component